MTAQPTVLHVPSLAAAVTSDLAYNQVHLMTAETVDPEPAQCPRRRDLHRPSSRRPRPVPAHTDAPAETSPTWPPTTRSSR
jgi:hypothetical protein